MPRAGIVEAKLRDQCARRSASYRLPSGRILKNALGFLDEDISAPLLARLSRYRALTEAAKDSLACSDEVEVLVTLTDPYQVISVHEPHIALVIDGVEVARVAFEVSIVFGLLGTAVVVRRGTIEGVESDVCSLEVIHLATRARRGLITVVFGQLAFIGRDAGHKQIFHLVGDAAPAQRDTTAAATTDASAPVKANRSSARGYCFTPLVPMHSAGSTDYGTGPRSDAGPSPCRRLVRWRGVVLPHLWPDFPGAALSNVGSSNPRLSVSWGWPGAGRRPGRVLSPVRVTGMAMR